MWGILRVLRRGRVNQGSIPTRVGNTPLRPQKHPQPTVHSHACGEYVLNILVSQSVTGPSPRVWGILFPACASPAPPRSIPTRVGNTTLWLCRSYQQSVHPHACGEYLLRVRQRYPPVGPSPRVWGIRTYATIADTQKSVHPHACGEYDGVQNIICADAGPSPRVWGILCPDVGQVVRLRSIPTRVGNTLMATTLAFGMVVHPHACGEYARCKRTRHTRRGPSPRVWGIRNGRAEPKRNVRSIPTRVGNTLVR